MLTQTIFATLTTFALLFGGLSVAQAQVAGKMPPSVPGDCLPHYTAPTNVFGLSKSDSSDTGVSALRFLELSVYKHPVRTVSGVDLNSGTTDEITTRVDMPRLKHCGADFAFIRLSGLDDYVTLPNNSKTKAMSVWQLWNEALAAGIEVYPYHYLYPSKDVLEGKVGSGFPYSDEEQKLLTERMEADGHAQATLFIKAYTDSHLNPQPSSKLGFPQYIALDIEKTLPKQFTANNDNAESNRYHYSVGYAKMACAWIQDVRQKFSNATIIIYTNMQMDQEYSVMNIDYTDSRCLAPYDVWMALPTVHGGHFAEDTKSAALRTSARKFCFAGNAKHDRCIFHQYTQRAEIGLVSKSRTTPHLDLNRYHAEPIPWDLMPAPLAKKPPTTLAVAHGS